jgi:hypothetical protein
MSSLLNESLSDYRSIYVDVPLPDIRLYRVAGNELYVPHVI